MNRISCPHEETVSNAARTGCWDNSTRAHVRQCAHCREIAGIAEWMGSIARVDIRGAGLPGPERVYLNAKIAAMQAAQEKALRPLAIAESVVRTIVILALAGGIFGLWFGFRSLAASLPSSLYVPQPILISAAALVTCMITLLFTRLVQPILIEE